jgi:hypothetical protein
MVPRQPKFLVLSNGLRDHLGHYFETSVSVAEAAHRLGFHAVLATHVECRRQLLPNWLESHAIFRTDHWMSAPPAAADGGQDRGPLQALAAMAARAGRRARWFADRGAYFLLPPAFYDAGRLLRYCCLPRIAEPDARTRVAARLRARSLRRRYGQQAALFEQAAQWPEIMRALRRRPSASALSAIRRLLCDGLAQELEYALVFQQDLERLLAITEAGSGDHVLMGTAHARELLAVQLAVERIGPRRSPTFHLEFRHSLFERDPATQGPIESAHTQMQRTFLSLYADSDAKQQVRLYTDSDELSRDYESIVDLPFGVLPLPFRAHLISDVARLPGAPVTIVYLGEARDEKGFPWLPELIDALSDEYLATGKARFLIQSNVSQPQYNPRSAEALERLKRQARPAVELRAADSTLSPDEYYALASQADIVLVPYARERYRACTSGVFAEALAVGAPTVVPTGTWMAHQLPRGGGETFHDFPSFVRSVKRLLDDFDSYRAAAMAHRAAWRARHSPEALVAEVVGASQNQARFPTVARAA